MELREYITLFKRWAWLLILGALLGIAAGYAYSRYQTPIYQATAKVLILQSPEDLSSEVALSNKQLATMFSQLLLTRPVLETTSERLNYPVVANQVKAQFLEDAQLIIVSVENSDAQRSADIANTLVNVFLEYNETLQIQRFSSSEESLLAQLQQVEMQINNLQEQQTQSSEENLDNTINLVTQTIADLQAEILSLQEEIVLLTQPGEPYEAIEPVSGRKILVTATPSAEKRLDLVVKQDRLDELGTLLNMYQRIFVDLEISRVSSENASNRSSEQLRAALALYQQIYSNLLSNYEQIRLARMKSTPNIVQVEEAIPPISPIRPRPFINIALGFSLGLVIAAGIAYVIEYLDDTLRSPEDVAYVLQLPILGYIAEMSGSRKNKGNKNLPITFKQPRSPVAEAFRSLRANLEFADVDQPLKSILITSAGSSEGKTTVAVNLALVLAQAGNKVILLDGDLRRPRIHRFLDIPNRVGLSDLLRNHAELQSVIQPWKEEQLSVITSGSLPPNPAEVLGSGKMAEIIQELTDASDMVIVDGTPSMFADASVLSTVVDGVLIVVRLNRTQANAALTTLDQFNRRGAKIIGVVINHAQRKHSHYYKEYGDSQHFSYDYTPGAAPADRSPT